ncbi:glycosyltransferase family 2 protein [Thalassospira profundimaris]|uniref:glycosyltransferase family 2 protein n=1 Tax=Thalassospira profundimaris TaxID=502049 RepID=UPI0002872237|nr:glycosyltransferase [Thalassospira profundimaris]EKF09233.1 glycosyltransferase [Thalassospira profundimaris WP0211]
MSDPRVSVIMPIFNGADDLERALDSILGQTFQDFEVIAINDGSKDNSYALLNAVTDPRVKVVHQDNMGLAGTLNRGLSMARGALIARQDQDDLSHPERFERQVSYFDAHPDCILLGTAAEIWIGNTPTERTHDHPTYHEALAFELLFNNPFVHSSVMMCRDAVLSIGGYSTDRERQPPEDYELWSRMARTGRVANLKDRLLVYREVPQSMSRNGPSPFLDRLVTISAENIAMASGRNIEDDNAINLAALTHSALDRMKKKANLTKMQKILEDAVANIAPDDPDVATRAAERVRILRYQWTMYRMRSQWAMPLFRRFIRCVRRLPYLSR